MISIYSPKISNFSRRLNPQLLSKNGLTLIKCIDKHYFRFTLFNECLSVLRSCFVNSRVKEQIVEYKPSIWKFRSIIFQLSAFNFSPTERCITFSINSL